MATKAYALRVKPELSPADAKKAEQQLNSRFGKVAKQYGEEMQKQNTKTADDFSGRMKGAFGKIKAGWALAAGALAAVVGAVLSNPIDEADARLNEFLAKIDNINTRAQQWNVDPAKYYLATQVAATAGVKDGLLDTAFLRIADRLEMARSGEDVTLRQFLDADDIVDASFRLFQTWANMNPTERAASMGDILGTRQANMFAELVQTDWISRANEILSKAGGYSYKQIGGAVVKGGMLEEQQAIGRAALDIRELMRVSQETSAKTIQSQHLLEAIKQREALDDIKNYQALAGAEMTRIDTMAKTLDSINDGVLDLVNMIGTEFGVNGDEEKAKQRAEIKAAVQQGTKSVLADLGQPKTTPRKTGVTNAINSLWGGGL